MQTIPSGFEDLAEGFLRNPTASFYVAWGNHLVSGEWFRLDETRLDNGGMLTLRSYLLGETIEENINLLDNLFYTNESENIISIEGYQELIGDNFQYSISELDVILDNTSGRFWPKDSKNRILNPSFEDSKEHWNAILTGASSWDTDSDNALSGIKSMLMVPDGGLSEIFTDAIAIYSGETSTEEYNWTFSGYVMGEGFLLPRIYAYGPTHAYASGTLSGDLIDTYSTSLPLISGEWQRFSMTQSIPSGVTYLRCSLDFGSALNVNLYSDNNQLEFGSLTDYDIDFIGDEMLPRQAVKAFVGFEDNQIQQFAGYTNSLTPSIKDDTTHINSLDLGKYLQDTYVTSEMFTNLRTDQVVQYLAEQSGLDSTNFILESGVLTIPFVWFQEGSAWFYMKNAAEAEGGRIFMDEDGLLRFWNRNHFDGAAVVYEFDFDKDQMDINFDISDQKVKNQITVVAKPREVQASGTIYTEAGYIEIADGDTLEYFANLDDPATSIDTPVAGVNFTANSASDGSGTDVTADMVVTSFYAFAQSARTNIQNNSGATAYVLGFFLEGTAATIVRTINVVSEDANSELLYGVQPLQIENDWMQSESDAQALADQRLSELKEPRNFVNVDVIGQPYLQVGDKVRIQNYYDGGTQDLTITKNRWQLTDEFIQHLELEKRLNG